MRSKRKDNQPFLVCIHLKKADVYIAKIVGTMKHIQSDQSKGLSQKLL